MIVSVTITFLRFRRPGINKIGFDATYPGYRRRGEVLYDTVSKKFLTHRADIKLLTAVCAQLRHPTHSMRYYDEYPKN